MTKASVTAIELLDPRTLIPYEANAKKHPDNQIDKLIKSIEKFGWTQPVVVDKDFVIIAGHGRTLAAIKMGREKVPVIVRADLTKAEADALRLADNRVTSTEYDQAAIQAELQRLADELADGAGDFDLSDLGFDEKEINFTLADLGEIDDSFFVEDVGEAVEKQKEENAAAITATDDVAAPVGDALGFKRVTIAQSRALRELVGKAETRTGKTGPDALIEALSLALDSK